MSVFCCCRCLDDRLLETLNADWSIPYDDLVIGQCVRAGSRRNVYRLELHSFICNALPWYGVLFMKILTEDGRDCIVNRGIFSLLFVCIYTHFLSPYQRHFWGDAYFFRRQKFISLYLHELRCVGPFIFRAQLIFILGFYSVVCFLSDSLDFVLFSARGRWHGDVLIYAYRQNTTDADVKDFLKDVAKLSRIRHENVCLFMGACLQPPNLVIVTRSAWRMM